MNDSKWAAIAIESLLLGAVIAFIAAGRDNLWMVISLSILVFILTIQGTSKNYRFLYLYPSNIRSGIRTSGIDTWILRFAIISAVFFLFWGAFGCWLIALFVVVLPLLVSIIWDHFINDFHQKWIDKKVKMNLKNDNIG